MPRTLVVAVARIVPNHTRPYLPGVADQLIQKVPSIYANPIHVVSP